MLLLIPCVAPIIWLILGILMLLKWVFIDGWFIWATLLGCYILYNAVAWIRKGVGFYGYNKAKQQNLLNFYNSLTSQYGEHVPTNQKLSMNKKIGFMLDWILKGLSCDKKIQEAFFKLDEEVKNNYEIPNSTVSDGSLSQNLSSVKGCLLKVENSGWIPLQQKDNSFAFIWKNGSIRFFPFFCIVEDSNGIEVVDWVNLKTSHTKGDPDYHTYLHTRVDGGPDRRYSFNPLVPVYLHSAISFTFNNREVHIIFNGENVAETLCNKLLLVQRLIQTHGINKSNAINTKQFSQDEYAGLIRSIIEKRGKDIVKQRLFISILADYMVFREKPYLHSILVEMLNENYWDELVSNDSSIDQLNKVKRQLNKNNKYPETELTEAMSYIGYGLGIA